LNDPEVTFLVSSVPLSIYENQDPNFLGGVVGKFNDGSDAAFFFFDVTTAASQLPLYSFLISTNTTSVGGFGSDYQTYITNLTGLNPNAVPASVTWDSYRKQSLIVSVFASAGGRNVTIVLTAVVNPLTGETVQVVSQSFTYESVPLEVQEQLILMSDGQGFVVSLG